MEVVHDKDETVERLLRSRVDTDPLGTTNDLRGSWTKLSLAHVPGQRIGQHTVQLVPSLDCQNSDRVASYLKGGCESVPVTVLFI